MITYDKLWQTMKKRGVTQYDLYTHHNINRSLINRLKHNQNVETNTLDRLCNILHCRMKISLSIFPMIMYFNRKIPGDSSPGILVTTDNDFRLSSFPATGHRWCRRR